MRINIHKFSRNLLVILFLVYFSQGLLYQSGTLISQGSLLIIILISGAYYIGSIFDKDKKGSFYKAWSLFVLINTIGFIFFISSDRLYIDMYKNVLICTLSFFPFYVFSKLELLKRQHFIYFFILTLFITISHYYRTTNLLSLNLQQDTLVNNMAYSLVALIPFVFFIKNKLTSGVLLSIIIYFIIISNKRGAFIVATVGGLTYIYYHLRTVGRGNQFNGYFMVSILIVSIAYFAYYSYQSNYYLNLRMTNVFEGDSSGRDIIFADVWNSWLNEGSPSNWIFGFGFAGSLQLTGGSYAHNDWLELLSNFGITGVLIYIFIFKAAVNEIRNKNLSQEKRMLLLAIVSMWLVTTLFSMWYSSIAMALNTILIGYIMGSNRLSNARNSKKPQVSI